MELTAAAESGCGLGVLERLAERFDAETPADVVTRLTVSFPLVEQIESGTSRITDLASASAVPHFTHVSSMTSSSFATI